MPEILRGELEHISLPSVLQLMEAEAVTGWLSVGESGRVGTFRGNAVVAERGELSGVVAMLDLFLEPSGPFTVSTDPSVEGQPLGSVVGLIMEGCRLADEWARISHLHVSRGAIEVDGERPPAVDQVLEHLNGTLDVASAVAAAKVARPRVIDGLLELIDDGRLREVTAPPPPPRHIVPATADYHEAMSNGRAKLRAGEFDAAEASFERALELRPDDSIAAQNLRRVRQVRAGKSNSPFSTWFRR